MDWRAKVELFEQIRREYEFGVGTIAGVAQEAGRTSAHGARGDWKRAAETAEEDRTAALEVESGGRVRGADAGSRPKSAAQAATHGASHLGADSARATRLQDL